MKKNTIKQDMDGILNLIQYADDYPQGAIKIGYHYYKVSALIDALTDIKTRAVLDINKSDRLLMQILSGLI